MDDCLFCKIINGEIPSKKVFENDRVIAFEDIQPMAKNHVLFIHKEHDANVVDMTKHAPERLLDVFNAISDFALVNGLDKSGFRVVTNCGPDAGQTVFHAHFHVLFGEKLKGFGA